MHGYNMNMGMIKTLIDFLALIFKVTVELIGQI